MTTSATSAKDALLGVVAALNQSGVAIAVRAPLLFTLMQTGAVDAGGWSQTRPERTRPR